jgi:hypothetical protein
VIVPGWRAALWWIALALVCLALVMFALQGYLSPSAMIDFANMRLCALATPVA